ncbi:hypothetical protein [Vibrio cholerae]|uniref:hypothetical protein n=1 Tax=Vibrio cholerae TaxID=666 RepID=UPI0015600C84|nr:hypothetical protein [Vibrio cholerae]EHU0373428.1 hypothetical protein [Vibrio cholerae]EJL6675406.1 hypothetical protein [Vibrio cholerae]EJL6945871.1 hypothetical protein [Vibrio cholerae]NOF76075.1 hypothetical protein [Vibrio cholerae]
MIEQKIAHLTFIQGVINRMGQNSFLLKGWSVTVVAALFALSAKDSNKMFALIAYFPAFMFWFLDAFFLYQEILYRKLYEKVADDSIKSDKFTLNAQALKFEVDSYTKVVFSKTLLPFHGCIIGILLVIVFSILR